MVKLALGERGDPAQPRLAETFAKPRPAVMASNEAPGISLARALAGALTAAAAIFSDLRPAFHFARSRASISLGMIGRPLRRFVLLLRWAWIFDLNQIG